jgi:predicted DNA binding protein/PAS domain-containing protein
MSHGLVVLSVTLLSVLFHGVFVGYALYRRDRVRGWRPLVVMMTSSGLTAAATAARLTADDIATAVAWAQLRGLAGLFGVLGLVWFAAVYTRRRWAVRSYLGRALLAGLTALFAVRLTTALPGWPGVHGLYATAVAVRPVHGLTTLSWTYGPAYLPYRVVVGTSLLVAAGFVVEFALRPEQRLYRRQNALLVGGVLAPVVASVGGIAAGLEFDPVVGGALVGTVLIVAGLGRSRSLDVAPVSRTDVVERLDGGLLVLDADDRVVDYNEEAERLLGVTAGCLGAPVATVVCPRLTDGVGASAGIQDGERVVTSGSGSAVVGTRPGVAAADGQGNPSDGGEDTRTPEDVPETLDGRTIAVATDDRTRYLETRLSRLADGSAVSPDDDPAEGRSGGDGNEDEEPGRALLFYDVTDRERRVRGLRAERDVRERLGRALAATGTAESFAATVCEELAALEPVAFVWAGTLGPGGRVDPVASAGVGGGDYLEAVDPGHGQGRRGAADADADTDTGTDADAKATPGGEESTGTSSEPGPGAESDPDSDPHPGAGGRVAPGIAAVRTGTAQTRILEETPDGDGTHEANGAGGGWTREATARGVGAVAAVPVEHEGVVRGTLTVHFATGDPLATDSDGRAVPPLLEEAGALFGHALGAAERRRALSAGDGVELAVRTDGDGHPLGPVLADAALPPETALTVTAAVPRPDGTTLLYATGPAGAGRAVVDAAEAVESVKRVDRLGDGRTEDATAGPEEDPGSRTHGSVNADESRDAGRDGHGDAVELQVVVSGPTPRTVVAEHGGVVVESTVAEGDATVRARFAGGTAFDPVMDALEEAFGGAHTVSYRSVSFTERPGVDGESAGKSPAGTTDADPMARLTDRQREVLETAYRAGYFEYPRDQSASDVADRLGVSRPAFQEVLRAAERNFLKGTIGDAPDDRDR